MAYLTKHPQSKYWGAAFYDAQGKRRNRSTKVEATERNRKKAMKIAEEYEEASRSFRTARQVRKVITELHLELTGTDTPSSSVREYVRVWVDRKKNEVKDSTLSFYRGKTNTFLEFLQERADRDISEITHSDIIAFRDFMAERVAAKTANHGLKAIRAMFKDAVREGYVSENPTEGVRSVRIDPTEVTKVRPFTVDELQMILKKAGPEWQSMILFGVYTMLRLGDIARLTTREIDFENWTINTIIEKTGRSQIIPLAAPLIQLLKNLPEIHNSPDAALHPSAHKIMQTCDRTQTLSRQFAEILAKGGLREAVSHQKEKSGRSSKRKRNELTFHSLRHTGNSLLANAGIDRELRKSLTGHLSDSAHDFYTHLEIETKRKALDQLPTFFNSPEKP